ncbi:MAG: hypothetical protein ACYSOW_00170, partial [Planctomycetota bacterium]
SIKKRLSPMTHLEIKTACGEDMRASSQTPQTAEGALLFLNSTHSVYQSQWLLCNLTRAMVAGLICSDWWGTEKQPRFYGILLTTSI